MRINTHKRAEPTITLLIIAPRAAPTADELPDNATRPLNDRVYSSTRSLLPPSSSCDENEKKNVWSKHIVHLAWSSGSHSPFFQLRINGGTPQHIQQQTKVHVSLIIQQQTKVHASRQLTLVLLKKNKLYYQVYSCQNTGAVLKGLNAPPPPPCGRRLHDALHKYHASPLPLPAPHHRIAPRRRHPFLFPHLIAPSSFPSSRPWPCLYAAHPHPTLAPRAPPVEGGAAGPRGNRSLGRHRGSAPPLQLASTDFA